MARSPRADSSAVSAPFRSSTASTIRAIPSRSARTIHWALPVAVTAFLLAPARASVAQRAARTATIAAGEDSLQRLLASEDTRGRGEDGIAPLVNARASRDRNRRVIGVRALGRLERSDLIHYIRPLLADPDADVRREAVNALAQAAQGFAGDSAAGPRGVATALGELSNVARTEKTPSVLGEVLRAMGRLPYADSAVAPEAQATIALIAQRFPAATPGADDVLFGALHGAYDLARTRRRTGGLSRDLVALAMSARRYGLDAARSGGARREAKARIRRLALLTLAAGGVRNDSIALDALRDPDAQVRRLAAVYLPNVADTAVKRRVITAALDDPSFIVRFEGVRGWRQQLAAADCAARPEPPLGAFRDKIAAKLGDRSPHVWLAAIDAIATCADRTWAAQAVQAYATSGASPVMLSGRGARLARAHALVAWARLDPLAARGHVAERARDEWWTMRVYAARAAALTGDTTVLLRLAEDSIGNVREAAIEALAAVAGHSADSTYMRALSSGDYQVVLAASKALARTPLAGTVVPAVFDALDRLTAEKRENTRDPRVELLDRLGELGSPDAAPRLRPYLLDLDETVAARAAAILSRWSGGAVVPSPTRALTPSAELARVARALDLRLRIDMAKESGGGHFVIRLRNQSTPATAQRLMALAQRGYYDRLTFHRVEPTFVIQGGSPRANEYVGDGPFLRDELDDASHTRGTVGISTRGRDTGDAQIFVNLTDNYRLDHNYTVVGEVIEGMDVVDAILEGDVIARVRVVGTP